MGQVNLSGREGVSGTYTSCDVVIVGRTFASTSHQAVSICLRACGECRMKATVKLSLTLQIHGR